MIYYGNSSNLRYEKIIITLDRFLKNATLGHKLRIGSELKGATAEDAWVRNLAAETVGKTEDYNWTTY